MWNIAKFRISLIALLFILVLVSGLEAGCTKAALSVPAMHLPGNSEISNQYKWDLTSLYENTEAFDSDVALLKEKYIPELAAYKGKLNTIENLLSFFQLATEASIICDNVYLYPSLMADLDQTSVEATEMEDIASSVRAECLNAVSLAESEMLILDEAMIRTFMDDP